MFLERVFVTCAWLQHPTIAAIVGIVAVLVSSLGLFNPRGQPFVFHFEVCADPCMHRKGLFHAIRKGFF
jgi:hypothetical protein